MPVASHTRRVIRTGFSARAKRTLLCAVAPLLMLSTRAALADLYWSGAGTPANDWTQLANWSTAFTNTAASATPTTTDTVYLGTSTYAGGNTINLNSNPSVLGLQFGNASYSATIAAVTLANGTGTGLTIGSGGINNTTHAAGDTISATVTLGATQTWTCTVGGLTASGNVSGTGNLILAGTATITLSCPIFNVAGDLTITDSANPGVNMRQAGSTYTYNNLSIVGGNLNATAAGLNASDSAHTITLGNSTTGWTFGAQSVINTAKPIVVSHTGDWYTNSNNLTLTGAVTATSGAVITAHTKATITLSGAADNTNLGFTANDGMTLYLQKTSSSSVHALGGTLTIAGSSGNISTVQLGGTGGDQIADSANVAVNNYATFDLNNNTETIAGLSSSSTTPASSTITNSNTSAATLTVSGTAGGSNYSGIIQNGNGTVAIVKTGSGSETFSGANTYSGGTTLNAGTLNLNSNTALGTGNFTINAGTIDNTNTGVTTTLTNNNTQTWAANFTFGATNPLNLGSGAVTLTNNVQVTTNGTTNALTVGGVIGGAYNLTKAGAGTLALNNANTFGGASNTLTLSAGTLAINNAAALGNATNTLIISGGTLDNTSGSAVSTNSYAQSWNANFAFGGSNPLTLNGAVTLGANRTVTVNGTNPLTVAGAIGGGSYSLTKAGTGTMILSSNASTYSGGTTISAGTLKNGLANALSTTSTLTVQGTGTYDLNGNNQQLASLSDGGVTTGVVTDSGAAATLTINNPSAITFSGAITGANLSLAKLGAGSLTLSGTANTYSGSTTLNPGSTFGADNSALSTSTSGIVNATTDLSPNSQLILNGATVKVVGHTSAAAQSAVPATIGAGTNLITLTTAEVATLTAGEQLSGTGFTAGTYVTGFPNNFQAYISPVTTLAPFATVTGGINFTALTYNTVQTAGGVQINPGASSLIATLSGGNSNNTTGNLLLNLNAITPNAAGTVDFTLPGTPSATNAVTTTTANTATTILGGWATVAGKDWAVSAGTGSVAGNITPLASYSSTWAAGNDTDVSGTISGSGSTNSLHFNAASANSVTLAAGTNTIASGGILVSNTNSANAASITGGSLTSGNGSTLYVNQNNTVNPLTVSAPIVDASGPTSIGLTKSGAGTLALAGANSFSGPANINAGTVTIANTGSLGGGANAVILRGGSTLSFTNVGAQLNLTPSGINASVTADSVPGTAANIIDGNNATRWQGSYTSQTQTDWIYLNLGQSYNLANVKVAWESASSTGVQFLTYPAGSTPSATPAPSGSNWTVASSTYTSNPGTGNGVGVNFLSYPLYTGTSGQYLAIYSTGLSLGYGLSIWEMQLNLAAPAHTYNIGSLASTDSTTSVTLDALATLSTGSDNTSTSFAGVISGAGALTKTGNGTFTLTNSNTYTGGTTVSGGTLQLGASNALASSGSLVVSGGTFNLQTYNNTLAGVSLQNSGTITGTGILTSTTAFDMQSGSVSAALAGTAGLTKSGPGTVTITSTNTYTGTTTISAGILNATANVNLSSGTLALNGGTLQFAAAFDPTASSRTVTLGSAGGTFDTNSNNVSIAGSILGTGGLTKAGAGKLTLGLSNAYAGGTILNAGTLAVGADAALGNGSAGVTLNNATLDVTSGFATSRSVTLGTGSPTIQVESGTLSLSSTFSGTGSLTKTGTGILQLATGGSNNILQTLSSLTVSGGSIDLTNHDVLITHGAAGGVLSYLSTVTTSTIPASANGGTANAVIAWVSGQDYKTVTGTSALNNNDLYGKFTYAGDANLDGIITTDDYVDLDMGYLFGLTGWINGDFVQAGGSIAAHAAANYAAIDKSFKYQSGSLADGEIALHEQWFGAAYTDAFKMLSAPVAVPEPASLALLAAASLTLLRRKARK